MLDLKQNWEALTASFCADPALRGRIYHELQTRYQEPQRAYHTLAHIQALLELWQEYQAEFQDPLSVGLAIWFHDAIYNPRKGKNELYSARLAKRQLGQMGAAAAQQERVAELVMATAGHKADPNDGDALLFLDLDLSILGAEPEVYTAYLAQIRREYRFVPGFLYTRARLRFVRGWLARPRLFMSGVGQSRWEAAARVNLAGEMGL